MLIADRILGRLGDPRFAGRAVDRLRVPFAEAGRRRLRGRTAGGEEIAVDLPRPDWLADGAVLLDDGRRVIAVLRPPEPVMIVALAEPDPARQFRAALALGHALGNRHAAADLVDGAVVAPVHDTPELAARPVLSLGLPGLSIRFAERPFAPDRPPLCAGARHD